MLLLLFPIINVWSCVVGVQKILNDTLIHFPTNMSLSNISVLIKYIKKKRILILHEKNGKVNLGNVFCAPSMMWQKIDRFYFIFFSYIWESCLDVSVE